MLNDASNALSVREPVQTVAIVSGKGGTGKSTAAINLSVALAANNERVVLMDADLALGNIACMLNMEVSRDLGHVIRGEFELNDIVVDGPRGIRVLPAPNGLPGMADRTLLENASLIALFSGMDLDAQYMIIDVASGLSSLAVSFAHAAREIVVLLNDEPACVQDAFSMIRAVHETSQMNRFRVLANQTESSQHGLDLYGKLVRYTERRLDVLLDFCGSIPMDPQLRQSISQRRSVVEASPRSPSALAFSKLATKVERWPRPQTPGGHMEFFVERLVQATSGTR